MTRIQRRANRRNAQASTGPVTESGKETSKMNALKTGLSAQNPLLPTDNRADYEQHKADWLQNMKPGCFMEQHLVQVIIDTLWRLKRIPVIEEKLMAEDLDAIALIKALDNLSRHETRLRKLMNDTVKELNIVREARRMHEKKQHLTATRQGNGFVLHDDQNHNAATAKLSAEAKAEVDDMYARLKATLAQSDLDYEKALKAESEQAA